MNQNQCSACDGLCGLILGIVEGIVSAALWIVYGVLYVWFAIWSVAKWILLIAGVCGAAYLGYALAIGAIQDFNNTSLVQVVLMAAIIGSVFLLARYVDKRSEKQAAEEYRRLYGGDKP